MARRLVQSVKAAQRRNVVRLGSVLPGAFYQRPALMVARALLGQVLVHRVEGEVRAGRIVETEAYVGEHDLACHASRGRTARTEVLFGPAGRSYVYLIYGMHFCFNVVTGPVGTAEAVLVRGIEPVEGIAPGIRTDGPGRLTRALAIARSENGADLRRGPLTIREGEVPRPGTIRRGARIGVEYSGIWASRPFRFWVQGSPGVSRVRSLPRPSKESAP